LGTASQRHTNARRNDNRKNKLATATTTATTATAMKENERNNEHRFESNQKKSSVNHAQTDSGRCAVYFNVPQLYVSVARSRSIACARVRICSDALRFAQHELALRPRRQRIISLL